MEIAAIRAYNVAHQTGEEADKRAALERLGSPSNDALIEMAVAGLDDPDRNVRCQMVRLLAAQVGPGVARGLLRALGDPVRRVRKLAAKHCLFVAGNPEVEARLRELVEDPEEATKVRGAAFQALSGVFLAALGSSSAEAQRYFEDVPGMDRYRSQALSLLVSLDPLSGDAEELLRFIVETGTKREAVAATRALCGFKVVNIGMIPTGSERRRVVQTCELASGRVYYWVPRVDDPAN